MEKTIALRFAHGYLTERLKHVHGESDRTLEAVDEPRDYLYEIGPQFDDERESHNAFGNNESIGEFKRYAL